MSVLRDVVAWVGDALTANTATFFWNDLIDNQTGFDAATKTALKIPIGEHLTALIDDYNAYFATVSGGPLKQALLPLYSYVTYRYVILLKGGPDVVELITGDDTRNFYINWTLELPSPVSLFRISSTAGTICEEAATG